MFALILFQGQEDTMRSHGLELAMNGRTKTIVVDIEKTPSVCSHVGGCICDWIQAELIEGGV